MKEEFDDR